MDLKAILEEMETVGKNERIAAGVWEAVSDIRALHGVGAAQEAANVMAHDRGLGQAFADSIMSRLKEESAARQIFRPKPIPEEYLPAIAALEQYLREMAAYFDWLDEVMLGQVQIDWHDYEVGEEVDVMTRRNLHITLEPCSREFFEKMGIEKKSTLPIDAYVGSKGVILFVDLKALPRYLGDWLGHWVRDRAYEKNYRERNWSISDNHSAPRVYDLHLEAINMYVTSKLESANPLAQLAGASNPRGKEMTEWVEHKLLGEPVAI